MLWLGTLRGAACFGTTWRDCRVSGARAGAGGDGAGLASSVLLTTSTGPARSRGVVHTARATRLPARGTSQAVPLSQGPCCFPRGFGGDPPQDEFAILEKNR